MRIGFYGGSFDPVHLGHEWIARRALSEGLDRVLVMPCRISPHKLDHSPCASGEDRLMMLQVAFEKDHSIEISNRELNRSSVSYTWETIDFLRTSFSDPTVVLILGGDQFQVIETWTRYQEWCHDVEFLVFPRLGEANIFEKQKNEELKFRVIPDFAPEVSSTSIRQAVREQKEWGKFVSEPVQDWIVKKHLYRA